MEHIENGAAGQRGAIKSSMVRIWSDEADCAVQVLAVIPIGEGFDPNLRIGPRRKTLAWPVRPILAGPEQRFREWVVVADTRAAVIPSGAKADSRGIPKAPKV